MIEVEVECYQKVIKKFMDILIYYLIVAYVSILHWYINASKFKRDVITYITPKDILYRKIEPVLCTVYGALDYE